MFEIYLEIGVLLVLKNSTFNQGGSLSLYNIRSNMEDSIRQNKWKGQPIMMVTRIFNRIILYGGEKKRIGHEPKQYSSSV